MLGILLITLCLLEPQCYVIAEEDEHELASVSGYDNLEHNCDEPPPPLNGELLCGKHKKKSDKYVCKAQCDPGYQFPNKKTKSRHSCDLNTGEWSPKYEFPDCEPICTPPCQNNGKCSEGNHCICTPKYRGDRCQYAVELCDPERGLGVSAEWKCEDGAEETTCVMKCPQGTRYESPPADTYHCTLAGTWTPSFAPNCIPINVIEPPAANGMYSPVTNQLTSSALPTSGVCAMWGTSHYRTFDGGIYSFQGPCTYVLAKDCSQNSFAIHIRNPVPCESAGSCSTTLAIYIGSEKYLLTRGQGGGPVVEKGDENHPVPGEVDGLLFQLLSDYVTVKSSLGFSLKWNQKNTVLVKASPQLRNRTCGLCGKFDGSVLNDFETSDGSITDSVQGFVNSWTMDDLGERCEDKAVVRDACSEDKEKAIEAETLCSDILDIKFSACHELVDPKIYMEVCKMEHCACPFGSCYCGTLAEYFRECSRLGGKIDGGWRSDQLCPLSCPEGMIYKDCGSSCPRTCKGTLYDCEDNQCLDGCHCPEGMLLHDGRCIEHRECPCMHAGKEYPTGDTYKDGCNACECNGGEWQCTSETCEATCSSSGDPHYTTFDGLKYDFYGACSYYLVYNDNFTIVQEIGPCQDTSEPATDGMYCTSKLAVKYEDETLVLQPAFKVTLNDKDANLPVSANRISASMATDLFLKVDLSNGLNLMWDGQNRIYVNAPPSLYEQTAGLCGTFNGKQMDDFTTPNRDIEADASSFAARWEVSGSCHKRSRRRSAHLPCDSQPQKLKDAEMLCSTLKLDIFRDCHEELDPTSFYKGCISDLCQCTQELELCLCPIIADYSLACTKKGIVVNWVEDITVCKPECSGGQVYQECRDPCTSSCAAIASSSDTCIQQCVQGCACVEGTATNAEGFCVAVDQCPCIYEDKEYLPASVTVQGSSVCTCQAARWQCRPGTLPELASLSSDFMVDDGDFKCLEENNEEYTQCKESCPRTCQNMHLRAECKTEECRPGCRCRDGFLFDSESKKCVKESECGCVHGSKRYREGETIKQTCNLCTCSGGSWQCTLRECPGICSVWGESHFKTFDGKIFDFQGDCEYVLSKGKTKDASYSLSVQNVPCGTSGITCSKSFTIELGPLRVDRGDTDEVVGEAESLQLSRDEPVPRTSLRSRFVVVESGLFVTVFTDIGLSLQWDRGTRIYITAQPRWRERVKGLCGNFNDNQEDDFLTPSGGIPEATSSIFAESWKVHEFCPRPQTIEDACEIHPHRKSWAQQKCGILKAEAFSACHSEVPMEPYYERCVFDSCACDMGGDCECLCTAIAAYAQECNMHGVPVKWRSQELCPIQCEECATYDSCMSSCPKRTCENGLAYERIEEACSAEFCVEGCNPKPCPEGQLYNNGKEFKCIPEIECVVPCMELNGKIYNEGDRITDAEVVDACQTCHCVRGSIRCSGPPCADTEPLQPCLEGGWTPWVNTPSFVGGDYEVLTDPRLKSVLQNYCGIANMTEIECRVAETKQPYTEAGQRIQCRLPTGLSCKDEDQKDAPCEDYEIRVFCDCGPIPTTEITTVTVPPLVTLPPVCDQTGWTAWMSVNVPNEQGEFETLDRLRVNHYFCEESMIENVECRARSSWKLVTGENEDVICNSKVGLVCLGSGCEDYEVRVFCNCGVETTPAPVPVCVTGWTEYFNTDHPDISETGDDESLDRIRTLREFCVGGTIEDIECKAIINDQLVDYKELDTFGLKCSKNVGFECNQFVRPKKCEDFTVRFYCACEPLPDKLVTPPPTTTTTTPAPVTITPVPLECGWTPWINMDSPDFEEGDIEDLSTIQMLYKTCGGKDLLDIECRMARTHHKYSDSLQNNLICDTERGFRCLNDDQTGKCYDYEIRLLCMYPWCYPPTTTPVPTTTTENPCGEGKVYDTCAFHCGQVCSSLGYKLSEECLHALDGCIPGCRPVEGCQAPHLWRDYYTCVAKEDCFCTMQDENGTIVTIPPNEVIINGCEKCQCLENNMICHQIPGCGVMEEIAEPRLLIQDIVQEDCWTSWINLDKPDRGGGDLEVPNRIRNVYEYCQDPIKIECRTAISHQKPFDVGQIVTCDLHDGLICWNKDNKPEECYDYEIRFFCPCPSQTTTTVAPLPTLPPGPCVFGWTEWYNIHALDGRGDYETIQSSRIGHSFCSNDMISAVQCRQVGKSEGDLQSGVTCDLDFGLMCNSELLYGSEQCADYEIRFFCDCPTMAPATEMETLPPITTPAPAHLACAYWSDWINENHPSSGGGGVKGGKGVKGGAGSKGDTEKVMILRLKRDYDFCLEGYLSDIECREAETDLDYTETGDKKLACSLAGGFRCRGKDQPSHRCRDYKIRYFCSCETSTTTTTVKPTTPEITVPPCNQFYRVVDGPAPLPDSRLRASSSRDTSSGPQSARLSSEEGPRSAGAWIAGKHNDMQFLEIDLGQIQPVYGVVTKGRSGHLEWVKSYKVLYSRDGDAYHYVQDQNKDKIFSGNYDSDSEVQHLFTRPFDARFVRIQPVTFYKAIAMRADILGCASDMEEVFITTTGPPPCNDEMGMWNGNIRDYQISTSSNRNWSTDGRYARLNTLQTEDHSGGWVADYLDNKQYIQVNFMEPRNLTGVKTQGRDMVPQWVTAFYISYSQDGEKWNKIKDQDGTVIFPGNYDSSTTVITYFPRPIRARFLRIHPVFWENWIAMRFEVLGCYEQIEEEVKDDLQSTPKPIIVSEVCTEPMGFENYALPDTLIAVSSSRDLYTGASRIRLNTHQEGLLSGGWIPADYDYMPRVYIDFYEVRNLTGIITQGLEEADRWVVSYKVAYSLDNVTWDFATDRENRDIVFSGNVNRNGEVLRLFDRMITARFLEIIILDYHNLPALRMEVLGCFIPYPVYTPPPVLQTTTEICVEYGPWISLSDPAFSDFGDEEPIEQVIAATGLCSNPFEIECRTQVTKKDSSETGQMVSCDLSRGLVCKNAHQSSYQCYNYEVRIKCWTCGVAEVTTPVPLVLCPEIPDTFISSCPESCPPGFACDGATCVPATDCPCFRDGKRFQPSNVAITGDCQHCECVIGGYSRCEPINCPDCLPGQKPELDSTCHCGCVGCAFGTVLCPTSGECIGEEQWCDGVQDCPDDETGCPTLPPTTTVAPTTTTEVPFICSTDYVPDTSTCEMLSNVFETFDGVTYQYDICDHVLMKETNSGLYSVSVHKSCVPFCHRHLVVEVDGVVVKIGPGVEDVTVQDTRVPPANLWLVSRRFPDFEIKKSGNTIVFRSFKHNFDVTWDAVQDAKITVSKCLLYSLSGLCGLYNKRSEDDLTKPYGAIASGSQEFGDSWAIGSLEKCVPSKCPPDVMRTAIEVCSQLREDPFNYSCSSYVKLDNRIEACTTFMCECIQQEQQLLPSTADVTPSKDVLYDFLGAETCKCRAYESFAEACEAARQRPVQEWRIKHDCSPHCPEGMEWQDCGPGCELTCDNYHQRSEVCGSACVPGCYCPDGLVRHHNRCVKPKMCQDCVCRGHGDPNYISFDGQYYAFQGICTYVLAQNRGSAEDDILNFRILATNVECPEEPHTSCTHGLTIYWNGHVIEKFKNKPVFLNEKPVRAEDSPLEYGGISISYVPNKSTLIHIKEINLAVRYFDQMYGFNVELPAFFYFNKTEGLCGICNFIQSDDLYHRDGFVTENVDDFAYSWLADREESRETCELTRVPVPEPPPPGICNFTESSCDLFLDPTLYSKSCQNDVTYSQRPEASVCRSKFQYAQQCCERGVDLVEWLKLSGCESTCPEGMIYECSSACPKTCDNYKNYRLDDCSLQPLYTCACPEGKVLKLGQCVDEIQCEVCDAQGHVVGEVWREGPCKTCECSPDLTVNCVIVECPLPPACNDKETLQRVNRSQEECCDAYLCMPMAEKTCPEVPLEECPPGQAYVKDYIDGCPVYSCKCIEELCPPLITPLLDDGENYTVVAVDCCRQYKILCNPESCLPPPACSPGFKVSTYEGRCCYKYTCVPRNDVCVYKHKYDVVNGTQVDLPLEEVNEVEYEPGSSWQDGLCRKCSCVEMNGQFTYSCREEICPNPNEFPDADKYYREEIRLPGACCSKYKRTACVVQGVKYEIGEEWASPDGNPCKSYRCNLDKNGEAVRLEKTTICDTACPQYAVYVEAPPGSGKCCGVCKPIACEEDGTLYENGETWVSTSKPCFTAECLVTENGTRITYKGESCPVMPDNCAPENVRSDPKGCCTYCKIPTETCSAVEVPVYETRGFFGYVDKLKGYCSNEQVLRGLTKCGGQCSTESHYSDVVGDFHSVCNCCLPKESQNRTIVLTCEDGSNVNKVYMQPISCQCLSCSGNNRYLDALNKVEPYRK